MTQAVVTHEPSTEAAGRSRGIPHKDAWPALEAWYESIALAAARDSQDAAFIRARCDEGRRIGEHLLRASTASPLHVLDLGTGNGGVSLALDNYPDLRVTSLDLRLNPLWPRLRREKGASTFRFVTGDATRLPFARDTFDAVLCLEILEHVDQPARLGREVMRVLRPGGLCMITTPARFPHLFARDPHFGIPGLLFLPDGLQRWVATRRYRHDDYDVRHVFWFARSIARCFPGHARFQAIDHFGSAAWAWLWGRIAWRRLVVSK
jgi:SAM-dependent methyltransferase